MSTKVLIVEDNRDAREMWTAFFSLEGLIVITAKDGNDGFEKAMREQPDVIVTDVNMPKCDGVEMIKRLRAKPEFSRLPILALTGYGRHNEVSILEAGADQVMHKPVSPDRVILAIRLLLGSQRDLD